MSSLPILYSYRRCPYAMRARMALAASGYRCELREVDLSNKPAAMLAISPKGTVPVLQCEDGRVIEQSLEIMHYALSLHDPFAWLPATQAEKATAEALIAENDTAFKQHLNAYKYPDRFPNVTQVEHRQKGEQFLTLLETRLTNFPHLLGERRTLADIAIFPFIRQWAKVDEVWFETSHYSRLRAWLQSILSLPLFETIMVKYSLWQEGSTPAIFPSSSPNMI